MVVTRMTHASSFESCVPMLVVVQDSTFQHAFPSVHQQ